jgi:hypothetical protein
MPIHLAPISRRRFLARSLTMGAALGFGPELLAAAKPTDANSWALLSDIHLAADRAFTCRGVNMTEHFIQVARELVVLPRRPAGVFINGDCAYNTGQAGDYAAVSELLDPLRGASMPVHLALGNHDNRERFWQAFAAERVARRPLADRQVALLRTRWANWFILDSLEQTQATPGMLGKEQLDWLARALDANPRKPALVLIHHNPGLEGGNMGLKDTPALFEVIRPRKQVKAYFFGHTHHWVAEKDGSGIHLVNLPAVAYVFQAGEPSGWVHATLRKDGMRLELRCIDTSHPAHGQIVDLEWRA